MRTCNRIRPDRSASCSANASGAFRDPGQSTTSRTPPRISSSTTTRACVVEGFTSTGCHNGPAGRRACNLGPHPGEELQRRGVDSLRPLEETEVPGVRYLQVTPVGYGIGDLATQGGRRHDV